MENDIQSILEDLYMIDPGLKDMEEDLKKLIEQLIKAKPDLKIDEVFVSGLRRKLNARAEELQGEPSLAKPGFMQIFNRFIYPFAGGVLAVALVVVVLITLDAKFKPDFVAEKGTREIPKAPYEIEPEEAPMVVLESEEDSAASKIPIDLPADAGEQVPTPRVALESREAPNATEGTFDIVTEADSGATEGIEEPVMMMAMPSTISEVEGVALNADAIRKEANDILIAVEKWMTENWESASDEQKELLSEKVKAITDLLEDEKSDPEAIKKATEELEQEVQKITE